MLTARPQSVGDPSNRPEMRLLVRHDLMRDNDSFALGGTDTIGKLCARTTDDPSQLRSDGTSRTTLGHSFWNKPVSMPAAIYEEKASSPGSRQGGLTPLAYMAFELKTVPSVEEKQAVGKALWTCAISVGFLGRWNVLLLIIGLSSFLHSLPKR